MKSFGTFGNRTYLATSSKTNYIFKIILLLTRPFHTRFFVPDTILTVTLAGLASHQIVSLYLSHAVDGTVNSHRWQDWSLGLNEPTGMLHMVTTSVTARVTATVTDASTITVTPTAAATVTAQVTDRIPLPNGYQ